MNNIYPPFTAFSSWGVTPFQLQITYSPSFAASLHGTTGPAFQAIGTDPMAIAGVVTTEVGGHDFLPAAGGTGNLITSYTLGDDGFVAHNLGAGQTVDFMGTTYTSFNICSNGIITFAAGTTDFTETMVEFFGGWGSPPNPGVAVAYSDLNRGGLTSGATYDVIESTTTNSTTVIFTNQNWWSSQDPAGTFSAQFGALGPGSLVLDYTGMSAGLSNTDDMIFGVTDGDAGVGTDTDLTDGLGTGMAGVQGTYSSSGMGATLPDSVGELIPANTAPLTGGGPGSGGGIVTFLDTGLGDWVIF